MEQPEFGLVPFEQLFEQHRDPMLRLAYVLLDDHSDAEEVVQEAFTELFRRWSAVTEPLAYLRSSVINGCRKRHRWRDVRRRIPVPPPGPVPEYEYVYDLIQRLPSKRRTIVVLRFYLGMSDAEIAETLEISIGTVKSNISRALDTLRGEIHVDG